MKQEQSQSNFRKILNGDFFQKLLVIPSIDSLHKFYSDVFARFMIPLEEGFSKKKQVIFEKIPHFIFF